MTKMLELHHAHVLHCYEAPPAKVFAAWLDPLQIGDWMFGPKVRDETVIELGNDPHVGGRFRYIVERAGVRIEHIGEYLEIVPGQRLVFTWGATGKPASTVKLNLAPFACGCQLDLVHELSPGSEDVVDRVRSAWSTMLDQLGHTLAEAA